MTIESINNAIKNLIEKRRDANIEEQERINVKLSKLYEIKYIALLQQAQGM